MFGVCVCKFGTTVWPCGSWCVLVGNRSDERRSVVFASAAIERQVKIARTNTDARSIHMTGYIFMYIFANRWAAYERLDSFLPLPDEVKIQSTQHIATACYCHFFSFVLYTSHCLGASAPAQLQQHRLWTTEADSCCFLFFCLSLRAPVSHTASVKRRWDERIGIEGLTAELGDECKV